MEVLRGTIRKGYKILDELRSNKGLTEVMPAVEEIIDEVKDRKDDALVEYTEKFDGIRLSKKEIAVKDEEIEEAKREVDANTLTLKCIKKAFLAIKNFHYRQKRHAWGEQFGDGIFIGEKYVPFDIVGVYVPASYFSSALMCVTPAKIAGVSEIIVCTPPNGGGKVDARTIVAADMAGATKIYKVGGAQAIAALAFGTEIIPSVQKIVGPGNEYVTAAKMLIRKEVEIDFPAGPSEILIIGDETSNPDFIARDMIAQMEHGEKSTAILLTPSSRIASEVEREILCVRAGDGEEEEQQGRNWILIGDDMEECINFANEYAPEHLEMMVNAPIEILKQIKNAGSVFIGDYSPVAAGDYATGANHVLPTAGYARIFSGLDVHHFMRRMTVQMLDKEGLEKIKDVIINLSKAEGMEKHAESIEVRFR